MKDNFSKLINNDVPVLVDFYADWCQPCKILAPTLKEVATELKGNVRVIKIDVDKNPKVASKYSIRGVPTLMLFKNGKAVWRQSGVVGKQEIVGAVNKSV